jgi:hypothetical protein
MATMGATLTFLGAAGTVTGSAFLLERGGRIRDELDWTAVVPRHGEKVRVDPA